MPIFQDDICHVSPASGPVGIEPAAARNRRLSEESLRTELCEGPVLDGPMHLSTPKADEEAGISDRAELIQRLKRGESPTWIPGKHLESMLQQENTHHAQEHGRSSPEPPNLLPPATITPEKIKSPSNVDARQRDGLDIERPRSAFHSGDFTRDGTASENRQLNGPRRDTGGERGTPEHAWFATSPPRHFTPFSYGARAHGGRTRLVDKDGVDGFKSDGSPLSTSLSSFVYQPPTSPLVQSESNEDVDFSTPPGFPSARHSKPVRLASSLSASSLVPSSSRSRLHSLHSSRREGALPYQAHQPRRSLTSAPSFGHNHHTVSSPQTPAFMRSRRQSFGPDTSPIQHASMVGSYEESILRGRMSTTPSKPFEFLAQIGVLGKGNCKPSLRCPRHVTLPFPAVYYSYGSASHGQSPYDDGPSPYVGQIDLENGLSNSEEESRSRRKAQSRYSDKKQQAGGEAAGQDADTDVDREGRRPSNRLKRSSGAPRAPPGGSYRIPETGQIQIVIKNPNKTAVKLFLVPYDLTGMMPGTKTFIRQRSYSAGPIIDNVPNMSQAAADRPILRYLVHLHICCPAKGRFYLYKSIRVVFANRVPDGKEKLRNETTWPEPRFSPYKPIRVMNPPLSTSGGAGAMLANDKALRRRSLGLFMSGTMPAFDGMDGIPSPDQMPMETPSPSSCRGGVAPVEPIPLRLPRSITAANNNDGGSSSQANTGPSAINSRSPGTWGPSEYEKLNRGDAGYGCNAFNRSGAGSPPGNAPESLLSQRLRGLGVKPQQTPE
ncbi:hypothetical protein BBK36DRAFT_1108726 [Trichoderma citrinoviride]|uniref:Atos-like conserved domain-containing protein n=1 Tax=Trichoderma citrinoviride TaxID=58853 RepID=A0A2T4BNB9_9HYPO|nr:hypothetical protein BBK36DRAFT_1108726 [Trichoderma citrinoviride]PTB70776.1 hypothetical protein BBK36DRAFT_1108726 [Trichoderma citrinoviride]